MRSIELAPLFDHLERPIITLNHITILANVNSRSRSLYAVPRPFVVCLSVCNVRASYSAGWNFPQFFTPFGNWPSVDIRRKFYWDRPRRTPPSGELNARGVAQYSDFRPIEGYISETVQDGGKLVLITNRKSYMSFRSIAKSVTLNDLERRNGR